MSPRTYEEELSSYERSSYDAAADDHELTLGTPTVLGLFFALVLVCGCFFGLGYAMGHRIAPATPQVFGSSTAATTGAAKPTAGSAVPPDASSATASTADAAASPAAQTATVALNAPAATPAPPASTPATVAASAGSVVRPPASLPSPALALAPGNFVVQVAAVSSQDVANILLAELQKKGYAVGARHESQDQLLHIQIGPFPNRKDAEAMRQRVITDGFNAIVK